MGYKNNKNIKYINFKIYFITVQDNPYYYLLSRPVRFKPKKRQDVHSNDTHT